MKTIIDSVDIALMFYRYLTEHSELAGSKHGIIRCFKEADLYNTIKTGLGKLPQPVTVVQESRKMPVPGGQPETIEIDQDVCSALTNIGYSAKEARELASSVSGATIEERIKNALVRAEKL